MKFLKISANGQMVKLGEDQRTAQWYYVTEAVKTILESLKVEDEVSFKSNSAGSLIFLAKGTVTVPELPEQPPQQSRPLASKKTDYFDSSTSIKQTCMHATSRIMIALQGQVNPTNVVSLSKTIYSELYKIINE